MHRFLYFPLLLTFLALGSHAQNDQPKALDSLFRTFFPDNEPGGAVLIARDGQVKFSKGYGISDMRSREQMTTKTLLNLGSISKTFVAYGILQLAEEKKLSLNDPVGKYFPGFRNKEIAQKVKLFHLLTHSSGLPDNRRTKEDSIFYLSAKDLENFNPILENDSLHFEPGERFEYSNPAFNGLALVIEQVTKMKWQDYIRELIFRPAGMKRSTITDGSYPEKGVAHAYLTDGVAWYEQDYGEEPTFAASGNGGVWSNVEELWKYELAIQRHRFLNQAWISSSRTPYPLKNWKGDTPPFIGLSWFITEMNGIRTIGHTGSQGGFLADYLWVPDEDFFYVVLCNTPRDLNSLRAKVFALSNIKNRKREK